MVAESAGLMPQLSKFVIKEAAQFVEESGCPVSINLSVQDIQDPSVKEAILVWAQRFPPGSFILEFLERSDFHEIDQFQEFLTEMKGAGCLLALDDYGTGYSNLMSLVNLPLDMVKIDGALVKKSQGDLKALRLIKTLIQFCLENNLKIVAEHIDSQELSQKFQDLKVHYLQGYFLGEPLPKETAQPSENRATAQESTRE